MPDVMSITAEKNEIKETLLNFIVPLICVVSSIILFFLIIYPSMRKVPQLKQDLEKATTLRDSLDEKLTKINKFIDFKSVLDENSALVDKLMPKDQDVPGVLDQIDQIVIESGMTIISLSYSYGGATVKSDETTTSTVSSVSVSLASNGTYDQTVGFLKSMENAARILNVSNFRYNLSNEEDESVLSLYFSIDAPYMEVQSTAVTDEPISLDLASSDFVDFINGAKVRKFYTQLTLEQQSEARQKAEEEEAQESTPSAQ